MIQPRIRTVLFDLDGTLLDSIELIVESYQHTCRVHHLPTMSRSRILAGIGTPLRNALGEMAGSEERLQAFLDTYRAYTLEHHDKMVQAYPGVTSMIARLRAAGIRTGLVTSKVHAGALRGLKHIGLEGSMDVIIGADDVTHPKPDREPVIKALRGLDMPVDTACFVGDSLYDMDAGHAAGVRTIGITWGPFDRNHLARSSPTWYCATPRELETLVLGPG